jgi:glycosyltransferase involved in cell wall biosynthesis
MMKACAELGHEIVLATVVPPEPPAIDGVRITESIRLSAPLADEGLNVPGTWLQNRFRSFWGVDEHWIIALRQAVQRLKPDAVIAGGQDGLPYLPALSGTVRVWYAADEWVLHHLSQLQPSVPNWIHHVRSAATKGLYERAHRGVVDRIWVVSRRDQRAMQKISGVAHVDLLPNGVDGTHFAPGRETVRERTAVFWGRLDFGPNIQALQWFIKRVWPQVRQRVPDARFTIIGFEPIDAVRKLAGKDGVTLAANLRDLRSEARSHALAVMPFVSGAGIKNKLLEAAALGLPIVCTPAAAEGLRGQPPLLLSSRPDEFAAAIVGVWADDARRRQLGHDVRAWVLQHHTWSATARDAMAALGA